MTERVLTQRELNRAVLARQLLLERAALTPEKAVEKVAGLQTQYAPSGYIGLWSRLAGFTRAQLTDALLRGRIVQAWVMRCTIHMVSAKDFPVFSEAVRAARREWFLRSFPAGRGVDMDGVAAAAHAFLSDGPRKQAEIQRHLLDGGFPKEVWYGVQLWLDLVRVPPAGTWEKPRAHVYGLAPPVRRPVDTARAEEELVARYLRGFGPASTKDIASFCGWTPGVARAVLERMVPRRFRDEAGGALFDVPRAPLPPPDTPAPVRFLGQWDANLLVHVRRAQILPEEYRPLVFATNKPQSVPTVLVDGQVAGTWKFAAGRVEVSPFRELPAAAAHEVGEEARRLEEFYRD